MSQKYFSEGKISRILECQRCKQRYDVPLMMPCGKSVCNRCIQKELGKLYETKWTKFQCLMCDEEHEMPRKGLPVNENILDLLEIEAEEMAHVDQADKLQRCLQSLNDQQTHLLDVLSNKEKVILDHYELIRQDIYVSTQSRIDELNRSCDKLIRVVNKKEEEHLRFVRQLKLIDDRTMRELKELNGKLDKLKEECTNRIIKSNAKRDDQDGHLNDLLKRADELSNSYVNQIDMLNNLFYPDAIKIEFVESELTASSMSIGTLVRKQVKANSTGKTSIIKKLTGHKNFVGVLLALADGTLASGSDDHTIKLWNTSTGECIRTLSGHDYSVFALAMLPNGTLVSGSVDFTIKLWNLLTGECIRTLIGHTNTVRALAVLPDGILASGSEDASIKLWNTSRGECIRTIIGHLGFVWTLTVLSDGTLVSGSWDRTIKMWNTSNGQCIRTLSGHEDFVKALAILPDGILVSGSNDMNIKLWNTSTGECMKTLVGHTQAVVSLVVLSNGTLVSGSEDKKIKLWNPTSAECFETLTGHGCFILPLAILPDDTLVSGSADKAINMWSIQRK